MQLPMKPVPFPSTIPFKQSLLQAKPPQTRLFSDTIIFIWLLSSPWTRKDSNIFAFLTLCFFQGSAAVKAPSRGIAESASPYPGFATTQAIQLEHFFLLIRGSAAVNAITV